MIGQPLGLALVGLSLIGATDAGEDSLKGDLAKLQGTWEIISMEAEGKEVPKVEYSGVQWVFDGNKIIAVRKGERREQATFTLDERKDPKQLDTTGKDDGDVLHGIYQLDGDHLKLCLSKKEGDRPKEFVTKPGSEHGLLILKRQKR
jgi:uncharacterized protein (TIGR03067 family)